MNFKINKKDYHYIKFDSIIFIMSHGNYIRIYYNSYGTILNKVRRSTLRSILNEYQDYNQIKQCHRSFVVNTDNVNKKENYFLTKLYNIKIPISKKYLKLL